MQRHGCNLGADVRVSGYQARGLRNNLCVIIGGLTGHLCEAQEIIFQLVLSLIGLEAPWQKPFVVERGGVLIGNR